MARETERPFELYLDGATVSGRADVILDKEGGGPTALAILDYNPRCRRLRHQLSELIENSSREPGPAMLRLRS